MATTDEILDILEEMSPDAHCELEHRNAFELLMVVVLSAQTTDAAINEITPALLEAFKMPQTMAEADIHDIEDKIRRIGLYHSKTHSVRNLSRSLLKSFNGVVPESTKKLTSLVGVGRKTVNVIHSVCSDVPSTAVDTRAERISKRLGLAKVQDGVEVIEQKLRRKLKRERQNRAHHLFIFFGQYFCTAQNPKCEECPLKEFCKKDRLEAYRGPKKS